MAGIRIEGNTSGRVSEVDTNNNLQVRTPSTESQAGFVQISSEVDAGTVTGSRIVRAIEVTEDFRHRVGVDTFLGGDYFPGTALNTTLYSQQATTMTIAVANGFCTLNAGSSVATTVNARVMSYQHFPNKVTAGLWVDMMVKVPFAPVTNNVTEWGMGIGTGTTAPTDGYLFRFNAGGEFRCVCIQNSTELQSASLDFATLFGANQTHHCTISVNDDSVGFWVDDIQVARVKRATAGASLTAANSLPFFARTYNTGATSSAQQLSLGPWAVFHIDSLSGKPWPHIVAGAGGNATQGQTGGTLGTTAQHTNSATPAAAAPTNTTAALGSGLGGFFLANAQATAATDFIVSSYQNPAGTAALPGKNLYITGLRIDAINTGAAVATTPTTLALALSYGHTAVSLATTEGAGTKAPRRTHLGVMTFPVGAAIGATADKSINVKLSTPIVVYPGEFVQVTERFVVGTATASQVIQHCIGVEGYFE